MNGGASTIPAVHANAGYKNTGVMIGSRPVTVTMNCASSTDSRSHKVPVTARTTTEATRIGPSFSDGVRAKRIPATSSGHVQRYAAEGADQIAAAVASSQTGSVTLHVMAGRRGAGVPPG